MIHRTSLALLLLLLPQLCHAQIIMGGANTKDDTQKAMSAIDKAKGEIKKNQEIIDRLTDKDITLNSVGEFYYIYPPEPEAGKPWPLVTYDSSDMSVVTLETVPPGESVRIFGIMVGDVGPAKWYKLPARPHHWAVFQSVAVGKSTLAAWRNGSDPTKEPPVQTNKMGMIVKGPIVPPVTPPVGPVDPPVNPVDPPVNPVDPPVDPADSETKAMIAQFTDTLAKDKTADSGNWSKTPDWIKSYATVSVALQQNDPNVAIATVDKLFEKHKAEWLKAGVPPPPFLSETRRAISTIIASAVGTDLHASLDSAKRKTISAKYKSINTALNAAYAKVK